MSVSSHGEAGVTTIEVIVGFVIAVLAISALYATITGTILTLTKMSQKEEALEIGRSVLARAAENAAIIENRAGRLSRGGRWRLETKIMENGHLSSSKLKARWVIFRAFNPKNESILELRTIYVGRD